MPSTDLQRIADFRVSFARRQAAVLTEVPGGVVVLDPEYAASHEHNQLIIHGATAPADLPALADKALGHLRYRRITILDDATGAASAPALTAADYIHDTEVIMIHSGATEVPGAFADSLTVPELRPALIRRLCAWMPQASDAVIYQLADRRTARLRGADQVRFLAARDGNGTIVSWADLYLDPAQGIAQIEDVMTAEGARPARLRGHRPRHGPAPGRRLRPGLPPRRRRRLATHLVRPPRLHPGRPLPRLHPHRSRRLNPPAGYSANPRAVRPAPR